MPIDEHTSVQEIRVHAQIPVRSAWKTRRMGRAKGTPQCQGNGVLPEQGEIKLSEQHMNRTIKSTKSGRKKQTAAQQKSPNYEFGIDGEGEEGKREEYESEKDPKPIDKEVAEDKPEKEQSKAEKYNKEQSFHLELLAC